MDQGAAGKFPQKGLTLRFSGKTEASVRHPDRNEDVIVYPHGGEEKDLNWAAVLDGVGGAKSGDLASRTAAELLSERLSYLGSDLKLPEVYGKVKEAFLLASKRVTEEVPGGATTATIVKIVGSGSERTAVVGNVGDSRAYVFKDGKLEQVTDDDSLPIDDGKRHISEKLDKIHSQEELNEEELRYFMQRNVVTKVLGLAENPEPSLYSINLRMGDKIVLTSDGVHDNLTIMEIEETVSEGRDIASNLVRRAKERSIQDHFRAKKDDISAVVVEVT